MPDVTSDGRYWLGQPYRWVSGLKGQVPVYAFPAPTITAISHISAESECLYLSNSEKIEYTPAPVEAVKKLAA